MRNSVLSSLCSLVLAVQGAQAYISRDQDDFRTCWYRNSTIRQADLFEKNFTR